MAKRIFLSEDDLNRFIQDAYRQANELKIGLAKRKMQTAKDGELTFKTKIDFISDDREAKIVFAPLAWIKMRTLVDIFTSEVQWHGTVKRLSENTFFIEDIMTFPHEVAAATVISKQEEYEKWLNELDDETFNACRFHGHSHVNMGVTPSGVDMSYRHNVLDNFGTPDETTDLFYIFLITNKRMDTSAEIYDLQNNALYSDNEITIEIAGLEDGTLESFIAESKRLAKERVITYGSAYTPGTAGKPASSQKGAGKTTQPFKGSKGSKPSGYSGIYGSYSCGVGVPDYNNDDSDDSIGAYLEDENSFWGRKYYD